MKTRFKKNLGGVSVEYIAILVCIAVAVIVGFGLLGGSIKENIFKVDNKLGNQLAQATAESQGQGGQQSGGEQQESALWYTRNSDYALYHIVYSEGQRDYYLINGYATESDFSEYTGTVYYLEEGSMNNEHGYSSDEINYYFTFNSSMPPRSNPFGSTAGLNSYDIGDDLGELFGMGGSLIITNKVQLQNGIITTVPVPFSGGGGGGDQGPVMLDSVSESDVISVTTHDRQLYIPINKAFNDSDENISLTQSGVDKLQNHYNSDQGGNAWEYNGLAEENVQTYIKLYNRSGTAGLYDVTFTFADESTLSFQFSVSENQGGGQGQGQGGGNQGQSSAPAHMDENNDNGIINYVNIFAYPENFNSENHFDSVDVPVVVKGIYLFENESDESAFASYLNPTLVNLGIPDEHYLGSVDISDQNIPEGTTFFVDAQFASDSGIHQHGFRDRIN